VYYSKNITNTILQIQYYKYNITNTILQIQYYKHNITNIIRIKINNVIITGTPIWEDMFI